MCSVNAYCDGSGKGWVCTVLDYMESYQRLYIDTIEDPIYHEYHAILYALKHMVPELEYNLYNDNVGAVSHLNQRSTPRSPAIKQLVAEIMNYIAETGLNVHIQHLSRNLNPAGKLLDTGSPSLYAHRPQLLKPNPPKKAEIRRKRENNKIRKDAEIWWKGLPWYKKTELKELAED